MDFSFGCSDGFRRSNAIGKIARYFLYSNCCYTHVFIVTQVDFHGKKIPARSDDAKNVPVCLLASTLV